jgi:acyl-CoA reductase-like NAD-dependent aldehyde dehydrogenase
MQQANRLPYGLAAFAFTRSSRTVNLVGEQIEAGMVGINSYAIWCRNHRSVASRKAGMAPRKASRDSRLAS